MFIHRYVFCITLLLGPVFSTLWAGPIVVSEGRISNQGREFQLKSHSLLSCVSLCDRKQFCRLACYDSSTGVCLAYDIVISASFHESNSAALLNCFTNRPKNDVAPSASVIASTPGYAPSYPTADVLVDGYYDMDGATGCFYSQDPDLRHIFFDLGQTYLIKEFIFMSRNSYSNLPYVAKTLRNIRIRTSESLPEMSNLLSYHLLGIWEGSALPEQFYSVRDFPANARYVMFHTEPNDIAALHICNVEIIVA